ncbi:MAG: alpha/beta hydrolase [Microscillaceae bacterium]|jgi:non-heme chloroperoxidase|nr:alpha/beta hydrolase [Microscillaceae bacterium]
MTPQKLFFTLANGFKIAAEAWGNPQHKPVLLLHGVGQSKQSWGDTAQAIAQSGCYALALDARGHGDSDWSADGVYGMERNVADLLGVITQLSAPPAVVGASMGGMTALLAEGFANPSVCAALVLVDIVPRPDPKGVARIFGFMGAHLSGFESLSQATQAVSQYLPHRTLSEIESSLARNLRLRNDGRWYWHWDSNLLKNFVQDSPEKQNERTEKLFAAARNLRVPTLVVRGGMSDVVSKEAMAEFMAVAPQMESIDVAEAHHMVAGDSNTAFSEAVIQFLQRVY